jgi:hypothetical protein
LDPSIATLASAKRSSWRHRATNWAEVGDRLVIRRQPAGQPHHLHIAPGFALKPAARLNPVEIAVDIELQQHARMIARPAGRLWLDPAKTKATEIKLIDKDIDHPHRIVFTDPVFQPFGKQSALRAVQTLNKTLHQTLPPMHGRIISREAFLHSLGQNRTLAAVASFVRLAPHSGHQITECLLSA